MAPVWGPPYWGHLMSTDLVHWTRLPPALMPDMEYDAEGVFSGSATLLDDGTPVLFYTGAPPLSISPSRRPPSHCRAGAEQGMAQWESRCVVCILMYTTFKK